MSISLLFSQVITLSALDPDEAFVLLLINNITTALSFLGIIYFFWLYSKLERKSLITILVSNLILSDVVYTTSNVLSNFNDDEKVCTVEGFLREYSQLTTLFWAMTLAYSAFAQSVKGKTNLHEKLWIMRLLGYIIPLLISIVPFIPYFGMHFGKMGVICWIANNDPTTDIPKYYSYSLLLGHIWLALILVTYWYIRIYIYAKRMACERSVKMRKLFVYPFVLLISFFPVFIDSLLSTTKWRYASAVFHMATQHSNGFLNAITYGLQATHSVLHQSNSQPKKEIKPSQENRKTAEQASDPSLNYTQLKSEYNYDDDEYFDDIRSYSLRKELIYAQGDA